MIFWRKGCKIMANEGRKDFNKMLNDNKDMPKVVIVSDEATIRRYGGNKMLLVPPSYYDFLIKRVPKGKLVTIGNLREYLARENDADFTDPMTAGIFINIVAWASYQREDNKTACFRVLKSDGELNVKFPGGIELQRRLLEEEGHKVISKGVKNVRYYVEDFESSLFEL